jgi:hypothetical protein
VLKTSRPPEHLAPGWSAGATHELTRCVRASYRLDLMAPGQPCLLWLSGRDRPGVHAIGELAAPADTGPGGPEIAVRLTLLGRPVPRSDLLADPAARDAEVLRMPAGSNPSWLTDRQYAAVLAHIGVPAGEARPTGGDRLGPWTP